MPSMFPGRVSASRGSKAQITIEAIIVIGVFTLVFVSLINLTFERLHLANEVGSSGVGKMYGLLIASAINNVYSNGNGFSVYLGEHKLNFTHLQELGVLLPIEVNVSSGVVELEKNTSLMGGDVWSVEIPIIPGNITRRDPTPDYPELTIRNNMGQVLIYASPDHIQVVT